MSKTEKSILKALRELFPDEIADGQSVEETAGLVDLDVAYKLLLVEYPAPQNEDDLYHYVPQVVLAHKRNDGKYEIRKQTESGPDFRIITKDQAKIMRARFLLLKGFYFKNLDMFSFPEKERVGAMYDFGFVPDVLRRSHDRKDGI